MTSKITYYLVALSLISSPAFPASPPSQLFNKTVRVGWTQSMTMKLLATGSQISATPRFERTIYVSSSGRLFVRGHALQSGRAALVSKTVERGPEESGSTTTFQGNQIVNFGNRRGDGIATRVTVSFDPSFSSCTAMVNVGKIGPNPKITGIDGTDRELIDVSVSAASCSMSDGNGLAGQ